MSLLNKIIKSKQTEDTLEDRVASLQHATEAELLEIATSSVEVKLREAAIRQLAFGQALLGLALDEHPARVKLAARQHIGEHLEKDQSLIDTLIETQTKQSLSLLDLINLLSHSPTAIDKVFLDINDEKTLIDIALQGATSSVRQLAASKISSREHLETIQAGSKDKDKSVVKIAKSKLDLFKEAEVQLAERQAYAAELCGDLESLAKRKLDEYFTHRLEQLREEWEKLNAEEQSQSIERYHAAVAECQLRLNEEKAAEVEELKLSAEHQHAKQELRALTEKLRSLMIELYAAEQLEPAYVESVFSECASHADAIKERGFEIDNDYKAYSNRVASARKLFEELQENGPLSASLNELKSADPENGKAIKRKINDLLRHTNTLGEEISPIVEEARSVIAEWDKAKSQQLENDKKRLKKINELIRKAHWAIDNGRVRQARGIVKELHEKREKHSALPQAVVTRLEELDAAMEKLGDWHEFAVLPKKEALVEKMEALIDTNLHPEDLADKIKSMQEEWKLLCKGGENQDQELWERLQQAADKAFEPCREYFDEKAEEREQNLAKREELITQMNTYFNAYDWDKPVWKDVEQTLVVARETWKSYWPVPRKKINAQQEKFDAVLDLIHGKLREAREVKKGEKEKLVELALQLTEQEDTVNAINEAKKLQAQWKTLGGMGGQARKDDQKLWKKFRAACDVVFEKRDKEFEAVNAERKQELEKAKAILEKLDSILRLKAQDFIEAKKALKDLKAEFYALGELPKNDQRKIKDDFAKKCELIENQEKKERQAAVKKSWEVVYEIANLVRAYEEAVMNGGDAEEASSAVNEAINETHTWPPGTQAIIQQRLKDAPGLKASAAEVEKESENALRLLCIRKEISKGEESPAEDKALRMAYQVEQLQQGFGQKAKLMDTQEALVMAWLAVAGVPEQAYSELFKRFSR